MLTSIKNAELEAALQMFKGRGVLRGDDIRWVLTNKKVRSMDMLLWAPVIALESLRLIMAMFLIGNEETLETADIENAYLQTPWPEDRPPFFLLLGPEIVELLICKGKEQQESATQDHCKFARLRTFAIQCAPMSF